MDKNLLEILACPVCKSELIFDAKEHELLCRFDRMAYPVLNGIPILVSSRGRKLSEDELNG